MSAFALLPVLLLSPSAVKVSPTDTERILIAAAVFPLLMLIVSPVIAIAVQRKGPDAATAHAAQLAGRIEHEWHALTPKPLHYVGGPADLAYGVAAYAEDRPLSLPGLPAPGTATLRKDGVVFVCFAEDKGCRSDVAAQATRVGAHRILEFTLARTFLGIKGRPQRYAVTVVPPQR